MNTNTNNEAFDFEVTEEMIAEMNRHGEEFVVARNKFIAGEISEEELGKYINLEAWSQSNLSAANTCLEKALEKLWFRDIRYTRDGYLTTEDRFKGLTPTEHNMLIWSHLDCPYIKQIDIQRNHGRVRYNIHLHDTKTIFTDIKVANDALDAPLTEDVELKLRERDNSEADLNMGRTYMYVFDAFHEVYGVYPDKLSHGDDYVRLGRMMNLALSGECFDI